MATLETHVAVGGLSPIGDRRVQAHPVTALLMRGLSLAAVLVFIVLALLPNGATRIYQWPWSLTTALLALAPIMLLFLQRFGKQLSLGPDANLLLGLLAAFVVLSALTSNFAFQSLEASLLALGMLATVFCMAAYVTFGSSDKRGSCLQRWIGWFGIAFCLVSLLGWQMGTLQWEGLRVLAINWNAGETIIEWSPFNYRNESPLGHSNYTAGLTLLLLPWTLGLAASSSRLKRIGWLAVTALVGFVLFTSGSRGALIGVAAMVVAFLCLLGLRGSIRPRNLIGLGLIAVLGIVIAAFSQPRVRSLVQDWSQTGELNSGDEQRWNMLKAGLLMGADHPILGQGPGVTPLTYPAYRAELDGGVESALQLHSLPMQIWADLGLIGVGLTAGIGLIAVRRLSVSFRNESAGGPMVARELVLASAATSAMGYLAFSFTDFQLDVPVFAGLLAVNLGVIFGVTRKEPEVQGSTASASAGTGRGGLTHAAHLLNRAWLRRASILRSRQLAAGATLLILAPVLWTAIHSLLARQAFSSAVDKLERGDTGAYVEGVRTAMRWSPTNSFYPTAAGLGLLRFTYLGVSRETMAALKTEAAGFFAESLALNDDQEIAHFNLGWLLLPGNPKAAEHHFRRAAELVPDKGGVYLGLGLAGFEQGDRRAALNGFALEMVNDPKFATAPFWDIPVFASFRQPAMERAATLLDPGATDSAAMDPRAHSIMKATAALLQDLANEGPPGPLLIDRSQTALTVAKTDPSSRKSAIKDHFLRQRQTMIHGEAIDAYAALFDRTGPDAKAILNDPAGKEAPLIRETRRERPGYGILMRNLDVPLPIDAYVVQENAVVGGFFAGLFPPKGYLPTTVLVQVMQESEGSSR